jgi:uncharacterized protein (DUF4415 family)
MSDENISVYSLDQIDEMIARGEDRTIIDPPESTDPEDDLPPDFWETAVLVPPRFRRSVHLRLSPDVYEFFYMRHNGKGHIAKMQAVLKAYADAHR